MKIAVTGATGFVGKYMLEALQLPGVQTTALVRDRGKLPAAMRDSTVVGDLSDSNRNFFADLQCPDVLIHLAWSGLPNYKSNHHCDIELPRQYAFLKQMIENGLTNLVVTGTCFEYGMQMGRLTETMSCEPTNPYGAAKQALLRALESLQQSARFNLTWARLFYMYGEGQAPTALYSQLRTAIANGAETFDMSGGEQIRDFMPVREVARDLVSLAMKRDNCGVVNVCSGEPVSVRSLVETWSRQNNWLISYNFGKYPYPDYEPMAFWGSRDKLNSILGMPQTHRG